MSSFQMVDMSAIRLQLKEQADEIERLRAALRDIHAAAGNNHLIANIARAALGEKP